MNIDPATKTVLKIIIIILFLLFLWLIRDIVLLMVMVFIIVTALSPIIDSLEAQKIPRIIGVIIIYLLFLSVVAGILYLIIPPLIVQVQELANNLPDYVQKTVPAYNNVKNFYSSKSDIAQLLQKPLEGLYNQLSLVPAKIFTTTYGVIGGIAAIISVLVLTFYLLLEKDGINIFFKSLIPLKHKTLYLSILSKVSLKWGGWFRGQMLIMLIIGILDFIILVSLGVPYALTLAVFAGFVELIPYVGPVLAAIPAIIIAFFVSPLTAIIVAALFILVQELEGHIIVPKIMQKTVGLSPVTIILAILIGGKLYGFLGIILAVPLAAGVSVFWHEWRKVSQDEKAIIERPVSK